ncbi:CheR family methyltransferase [Paenibacillus elgii]|uniref:CheR family methyltransferase n=1 Tax=Paenibacillus elgii TaxID=189691 RepID=UPI0020401A1C|nr:CheR family methyltransferase [Paenibacillus elgii]MCM3273250.1 PAS domain-containing protein [Paenibacillus elgii]
MNGNQALQYRLCPYESGGEIVGRGAPAGGLEALPQFRPEDGEPELVYDELALQRICGLLNKACGIDFQNYKRSSLIRRIERRMGRLKLTEMEDYARLLADERDELLALGKDLLIGVTHFFRDPQAFETIQKKVIPAIAENRRHERHIRVWVAGCSTGEEAYSLAMLFHQFNECSAEPYAVKIFSTDLDSDSVAAASQGIYPEAAVNSLPKPWLRRYFTRNGDLYHIDKDIRKMVVFAHHNMVEDPPFSRLDLIACRNLLIYLRSETQQKMLSTFHFALNPDGFMFLGPSETIGRLTHLFVPYDRKWNIFRQKQPPGPGPVFASEIDRRDPSAPQTRPTAAAWRDRRPLKDVQSFMKTDELYAAFVDEHMPPCMVIAENNEVIHLSGNVNPYVTLAKGRPSWNIYKIVEARLAVAIVTAMQKVRKEKRAVYYQNMKVSGSEPSSPVNLIVKPFSLKNKKFDKLVLVLFEKPEHLGHPVRAADEFELSVNHRMIELEQELRQAEESLQATIEELGTFNEELQATNEELATVNSEYQFKLQELAEANDDMDNFLTGTNIGTVFLDTDLCIRRFTPAITKEINLLEVDCGRPFGYISHNFDDEGILSDVQHVLKTLIPVEREIRSRGGLWYSMRVLPYRTNDHVIKGIVLTFVDITELKSANEQLLKLSYAIEQSPCVIVIADAEGKIQYANAKFTEMTEFQMAGVAGSSLRELNHWDASGTSFEEVWSVLSSGHEWKGELECRRKNGPNYSESVKILPIKDRDGRIIHYLKIAEDITERKQTEELLRKSEMLSAVGQLAAGIAHEIRNPLTALKGFTKLMNSGGQHGNYLSIMADELERIEEIVGELLVLAKPQAVDFLPKSVASILHDVIMLLETQAIISKVTIEIDIEDELPLANCVENQLKQVFINVLKNGVEAMPGGGTFLVKAEKSERGGIRISFIDQGCGIPETKLAKLGQPFYTTKNKGTGLGLMVSYKIIENHRGSMTITSKEGFGTTVVIELPAVP